MPNTRNSTGIKWVKIGRDDYRSSCGRWHIVRLEAADNRYNAKDEWILADGREAVDVFPRLRDAKAEAEELASKGFEIEPAGIMIVPENREKS